MRGQRRASFLSSFADASHMRADAEMDGIPVEADQFGEAQAGLGREQQQRVIAASEPCRAIGSGEDRLDLRPRQEMHLTLVGSPNRDFNDLWLRFVSSVSAYVRQQRVDDLLRARIPNPVSQQLVRKAGRDIANNLSVHGYGMAYFIATEPTSRKQTLARHKSP
jgi:hypothetical protein